MSFPADINALGSQVPVVPQQDPPEIRGNDLGSSHGVSGQVDVSEWTDVSDQLTDIAPDPQRMAGLELLKDGKVQQGVDGRLASTLKTAVKERHTFGNKVKNFFKAIGRGVMNTVSAIRGARPFYRAKSVATFNTELRVGNRGSCPERCRWKQDLGTTTPVVYGKEVLASAFGLRGNAEVKAFTAAQIDEIRGGNFSLADIKQDPGLQDCWFLSSLGAFLARSGSGALSDLISIPEARDGQQPTHAFVKLGTEVYKVPLGVVTGGGKSNISESKAWVQLLETAMQMHLVRNTLPSGVSTEGPQMAYRNPQDAFAALQGVEHNSRMTASVSVKATIEDVRNCLESGRPVVVCSPEGAGFALSTGISPGHAVTVLSVDLGTRPGGRSRDRARSIRQDDGPERRGSQALRDDRGVTRTHERFRWRRG